VNNRISVLAGLAAILLLSGCSTFWSAYNTGARNGVSSSLVDYLYPKGEVPPEQQNTIPNLNLPLRVGIAFVPGEYSRHDISEATKMSLLDDVKAEFAKQEYIDHIEVIPDTYLRSSNGIDGMRQVARLYGVDVMALVSYDQLSVSEDNNASLLYWTIVGAYIVPATNNEIKTFVDTAVIDVDTAALLFRAPGVDTKNKHSTAVKVDETIRRESEASFVAAVGDMTTNLKTELIRFEEDVKNNPSRAQVTWQESSGGGGSFDWLFALLLAATIPLACRARPALRAA